MLLPTMVRSGDEQMGAGKVQKDLPPKSYKGPATVPDKPKDSRLLPVDRATDKLETSKTRQGTCRAADRCQTQL